MNNESAFLRVIQTQIHCFSLYPLDTTLLTTINPHILKILDTFHAYNHEVNVKRKDTVSSISNLKEIADGDSNGVEFDVEEFKKMSP
jgi:hypothetical protein